MENNQLTFHVRDFIDAKRVEGASPKTLGIYQEKLGTLTNWLERQGITDVFDITPRTIRQYLADLQNSHTPGGVLCLYRPVRTWINWLKREYPDRDFDPLRNIKQPRVDDEVLPPADDSDIRQMLSTCHGKRFTDIRDECVILTLLDSGCRAGEFIALRIKDVDANTGDVSIRPSTAKGRRPRTVFLGQKSRKSMRRYLAERAKQGATPEDPLWVNQMGDPLKYYTLREVLRRRALNAGLEREPSLHSFRRAFAIGWLRRGGDVETLRRVLGHRNLAVISRYLPLVNQDLQNAHRQYSPADRL